MTHFSDEKRIRNDGASLCAVLIEPWGMVLKLAPGATFRVVATSTQPGTLEVSEEAEGVAVWAWSGCTARVYLGDELVQLFDTEVPGVPEGMTARQFVSVTGASKIR